MTGWGHAVSQINPSNLSQKKFAKLPLRIEKEEGGIVPSTLLTLLMLRVPHRLLHYRGLLG